MDKQWVDAKKKQLTVEAQSKRDEIVKTINDSELLTAQDKQDLIVLLDNCRNNSYSYFESSATLKLYENHENSNKLMLDYIDIMVFVKNLGVENYESLLRKINYGLDRYLDSEKVEFDGDIIITDPCYIMRANNEDDWAACSFGEDMEALGIRNFMTRDTIYGDWGCTVYDTDSKESIGEFCADAGLVSVFLLEEVLKYNPDFDYHKERKWTTTLIPDFKGTVQFVVEHEEGVYKEDSKYRKAGDTWEDYSVHVVGHGVNKRTGEPVNFYSTQTSM